ERVTLRRDWAVVEALAVEAASGPAPPVRTVRGRGEAAFEYWREHALERFPLVPLAAPPVASDDVVRLDVRVGLRTEWRDLSGVGLVTGRLSVIDDYDPDDDMYGVPVVDLGAVREMKYPATLAVQGACLRIVGANLV